MKDERLVQLNFREIVHYGGQPPVCHSYSRRLDCTGYCVSCEDAGLVARTGGRLDLMSHGCDSADFEAILGPMPQDGPAVEQPVLFLLDTPGGESGNGRAVTFRGFRKQPPVNHYYWTPKVKTWPVSVAEFNGNFYGPYFAYLMRRHQLRNVYITNLVKCKWIPEQATGGKRQTPAGIVRHCVEHYLSREVRMFAPEFVLCFGEMAEQGFRELVMGSDSTCRVARLLHPSYIWRRWQTSGMSQEELVQKNDRLLKEAINPIA